MLIERSERGPSPKKGYLPPNFSESFLKYTIKKFGEFLEWTLHHLSLLNSPQGLSLISRENFEVRHLLVRRGASPHPEDFNFFPENWGVGHPLHGGVFRLPPLPDNFGILKLRTKGPLPVLPANIRNSKILVRGTSCIKGFPPLQR